MLHPDVVILVLGQLPSSSMDTHWTGRTGRTGFGASCEKQLLCILFMY